MSTGMGTEETYRNSVTEYREALTEGQGDPRGEAFVAFARRHFQRQGVIARTRPRRGLWLALGAAAALVGLYAAVVADGPVELASSDVAVAVGVPVAAPEKPAAVVPMDTGQQSGADELLAAPMPSVVVESEAPSEAKEKGRLRIRSLKRAVAGADLGVNDMVPAQTSIRTEDGGGAKMSDPTTADLALRENSHMQVEHWSDDVAVLRLEQGALRSKVQPRKNNQRYEVRTPYAVIKVVGTDFRVEHDPGKATRVVGFEGLVIVETLDGRLLGRVGAGESLRVMGPHVAVERTRRRATTVDAETPAETVDDGIELVEGPREWLVQARGMLADGRDSEAVGFLEERADSSWRLRALLGDAYRLTGDDDQARFAYEEALDEAGDRPPASLLVDLGSLLSKAGEPEAVQVWERYLEEYPEGRVAPKALWQLARVEISRGELDASKDRLRRILADFPASSPALSALARLGRLHLDDHDWEAADGLFSLYVRSSRKSQAETALVGMIRVRMAQRRFAEARALVEEYGSNFPDGRRKKEVEHLEEALP